MQQRTKLAFSGEKIESFDHMHEIVKEYTTFKSILEGNAEMVVFNKRRIKSIDCKLMSVLIEDALRAKAVEKIADDNYIFIRRAVNAR